MVVRIHAALEHLRFDRAVKELSGNTQRTDPVAARPQRANRVNLRPHARRRDPLNVSLALMDRLDHASRREPQAGNQPSVVTRGNAFDIWESAVKDHARPLG